MLKRVVLIITLVTMVVIINVSLFGCDAAELEGWLADPRPTPIEILFPDGGILIRF